MFGHAIRIWGCVPVIQGVFGIGVLNWELWEHVNDIWEHVIDTLGVYIPTGNFSKKLKIPLSLTNICFTFGRFIKRMLSPEIATWAISVFWNRLCLKVYYVMILIIGITLTIMIESTFYDCSHCDDYNEFT